jgi:hypothetical protein
MPPGDAVARQRGSRAKRRSPKSRSAVTSLSSLALKVSERRAKLLGIDAAEKLEAVVTEVTQADLELAELLRGRRPPMRPASRNSVADSLRDHGRRPRPRTHPARRARIRLAGLPRSTTSDSSPAPKAAGL